MVWAPSVKATPAHSVEVSMASTQPALIKSATLMLRDRDLAALVVPQGNFNGPVIWKQVRPRAFPPLGNRHDVVPIEVLLEPDRVDLGRAIETVQVDMDKQGVGANPRRVVLRNEGECWAL